MLASGLGRGAWAAVARPTTSDVPSQVHAPPHPAGGSGDIEDRGRRIGRLRGVRPFELRPPRQSSQRLLDLIQRCPGLDVRLEGLPDPRTTVEGLAGYFKRISEGRGWLTGPGVAEEPVRPLAFGIPFPRGCRPFRPHVAAAAGYLRLLLLVDLDGSPFTVLDAEAGDWVVNLTVAAARTEVSDGRDGHALQL